MSEPRATITRSGLTFALVIAVASLSGLSGCRTATAGGTVTPGGTDDPNEGPDPQGHEESNNIGDLEVRLDRLHDDRVKMSSSDEGDFGVCEDLCELASNICVVKEKLCNLADDHPGDDSYQDLCREARNECHAANESCISCAEGKAGEPAPAPESKPPASSSP
jgi:hypothetical protein